MTLPLTLRPLLRLPVLFLFSPSIPLLGQAPAAIVTEPTDLTICRAHRGFIWYEIETVGRAAHGSRYLEGIDANMHMGRFLAD